MRELTEQEKAQAAFLADQNSCISPAEGQIDDYTAGNQIGRYNGFKQGYEAALQSTTSPELIDRMVRALEEASQVLANLSDEYKQYGDSHWRFEKIAHNTETWIDSILSDYHIEKDNLQNSNKT